MGFLILSISHNIPDSHNTADTVDFIKFKMSLLIAVNIDSKNVIAVKKV